jgi:RNA polymerase sigma-70 factor (ECF subfamily)
LRPPRSARTARPEGEAESDWIVQTAPRALAYARSLVGDFAVAEDLVQDCYQRLLAKADRYDLPEDGPRLLFKAITNACINWTQRRPPTVSIEQTHSEGAAGCVSKEDGPVRTALLGELAEAVETALKELPVEQRAAIELHAMGSSSDEIADALETTPGNVRVLLHRGRTKLANRLKTYLDD